MSYQVFEKDWMSKAKIKNQMQQYICKRQQKIADVNRQHLKECDSLMLLLYIFSYCDIFIVVFSVHLSMISNIIKIFMVN